MSHLPAITPRPFVRMLVADDSLVVHELFHQAAERLPQPIKVVSTSNGRECMALLAKGDVGLAFIDVHMPEKSGTEALGGARHQGIKTFVTLMSGSPTDQLFDLAQDLRAYEFLEKPFTVDDVLKIIATYERIAVPMRALVVDDSATVRKLIEKVLAASIFHIEIEAVADGETALARCGDGGIDIVFLDCNMPGLDGFATLTELLARDPLMKVVMISAEKNEERERAAIEQGAVAFLHKPFYSIHVDALLHKIFGLRSPNLVSRGTDVKGFDVEVQGRAITVEHADSGHVFQFLWYRDPPHLRAARVQENPSATRPLRAFRAEAEKVAVRELKRVALVG
jgi:DNA-binding NtrC family response regulator